MPELILDPMAERKREFFMNHIGKRTREQLAHELYDIYMVARSNYPWPEDDDGDRPDPWPANLHLADVIDKYVIRELLEDSRS